METFFWISISVLFFCYAGYGLLLLLINSLKGQNRSINSGSENKLPVTLIVAVYNESLVLEQKIQNTLSINYPEELLQIIFISDGSTDGSHKIISAYPRITHLHEEKRKGKVSAINRAMNFVTSPVVIFSDANSMLNPDCVMMIASHYSDPEVGGVAGEKRIIRNRSVSAVGEAEGIYWQYESFLKKQDARFFTVVGAAGELFSIRTSLFVPPPENIILDDFIISMKVCQQGYRIAYEPFAYAAENPSITLFEEEKRKIRISAGAYQSIPLLTECLNIFKHPRLAFQYISRRLLRWVFGPPLILAVLVSNIVLFFSEEEKIYSIFLFIQVLFYSLAIAGGLLIFIGKKASLLSIPFYFLFMNYCLFRGFLRFIAGKQTVLWEKSHRQAYEEERPVL